MKSEVTFRRQTLDGKMEKIHCGFSLLGDKVDGVTGLHSQQFSELQVTRSGNITWFGLFNLRNASGLEKIKLIAGSD